MHTHKITHINTHRGYAYTSCSLFGGMVSRTSYAALQAAKVLGSEALGLSQRLLKHREQFLERKKMEG